MPVYSTNVFPCSCNACVVEKSRVENKVTLGFGVMLVAGRPPCLIGLYGVDMSRYLREEGGDHCIVDAVSIEFLCIQLYTVVFAKTIVFETAFEITP